MAEILEFDSVHAYSLLKTGISVETTLRLDDLSVDLEAKLDTGATHCIFERHYGETLGLDIE